MNKRLLFLSLYLFFSSNIFSQKLSLASGFSFNHGIASTGWHIRSILKVKNKIFISPYFEKVRPNSNRIKDKYFGLSLGYDLLDLKKIQLSSMLGVENNLWSNHAEFNSKHAQESSLLYPLSFRINGSFSGIEISYISIYNFQWNELRSQISLGFDFYSLKVQNKAKQKKKSNMNIQSGFPWNNQKKKPLKSLNANL